MDTVESNKRTSADHHHQHQQQQHEELEDEDIPTSIADIDNILQYEGEEVTIDSQQTTAPIIVDEDADVYLEVSSADGGTDIDELSVSHSEHVIDSSLDDEMVIVEVSTDIDMHHSNSSTQANTMKAKSLSRTDERLSSTETVVLENVSFVKLPKSTDAKNDERTNENVSAKLSDDRLKETTVVKSMDEIPMISKNVPQETIEHTVNLLNNNKILIKCVKTTSSASASPILGKNEIRTRCDKIDENSLHSINLDESNESPTDCDSNTKLGVDAAATAAKNAPFENEFGGNVSVQKLTAAAIAAATAASTSTPKIRREFEQLQKTVNESKVLTEFITDQSTRGRRSLKAATKRKQILTPNTSISSELSTSVMEIRNPSPPPVKRSQSKESNKSGTSISAMQIGGVGGVADRDAIAAAKRNTRSQNSDFSAKQQRFLKGIQQITRGTDDESENSAFDDDEDDIDYDCDIQSKQPAESGASSSEEKHAANLEKMSNVSALEKVVSDTFCWRCHQGECQISCSTCIRAYHLNCVKVKQSTLHEQDEWQCPECVEATENEDKKKFDAQHLSKLLKFAMDRILIDANSRQFQFPFDKKNYPDHVINAIDLPDIENKVESMRYTSPDAFMTDIKWILHNCYVCCSHNYKLMGAAKSLLKVCKQEMYDIETCAECYLNANTMVDNWFTEVCAKPHLVLWAKLKGFPYWPAKAMTINAQVVDVRFFGDHDRAFVPAKDCYLYSRQDPNPPTNKYKRNTIADCVKEVDIYIENIIAKFGAFKYAELKSPFNPYNEIQHLFDMIPGTRSGRSRRRSTAYKSDLRLCIVKTADNNLSIVKKCSDRSPMSSQLKIIDLVDENSSTPPTSSVGTSSVGSGKKRSSESKNKSNKLSQRITANAAANEDLVNMQHKTYQAMRRKSMAVEKEHQKKVSAVILKRKSISGVRAHDIDGGRKGNFENEIVPSKRSKTTASINKREKNVTAAAATTADTTDTATATATTTTADAAATVTVAADTEIVQKTYSSKKHKRYHEPTVEHMEIDKNAIVSQKTCTETEKSQIADDAIVTKDAVNENILASVGLSRIVRTSKDETVKTLDEHVADKTTEDDQHSKGGNSDEDKDKEKFNLRLSKETIEVDADSPLPGKRANRKSVCGKSPKIVLVPFIELKEEPNEDTADADVVNECDADATSETNDFSAIKTERRISDDDSVLIIDDDPAPKPSPPAGVSKLIENIRRGAIAVRDIDKMTKTPPKVVTEAQRARKTFPRGLNLPASMPNGVNSGPRNHQPSNKRLPAMNNMVYIPLEGSCFSRSEVMPSISGPKLSSQPPPLTIVGSTPPTVSSSKSNITNLGMNGPPPLSLTAFPSTSYSSSASSSAGASLLINQNLNLNTNGNSAPAQMSSLQQSQSTAPPSLPPLPTLPPPAYSLAVSNARVFGSISSGLITEQLASAVTDSISRGPPKLTSRPTAPLRSDGDTLFPIAGSVCKTLIENAHKMTDFFRSVIEDTISDIANTTNPEAKIKLLEMELEKTKYAHAKEIMELKSNTDTLLSEMKKSMEKERHRTINETRKQCESERIRCMEETKKKQWCIHCGKEAQFYCCWNTSYCDYPCQLQHWSKHKATCTQVENNSSEANNHRRNNLNAMTSKQIKNIGKDNAMSAAVNSGNRNPTAGMRNAFQKNSLLQKFNYPSVGPNHATNPRQTNTRTMSTANQQCYAILSQPCKYEVFNAKPNTNLIHPNFNASVSLANLRSTNAIIVSTPTTGNTTQMTSFPIHATSMPPPLAASKPKQIINETIIIPSD